MLPILLKLTTVVFTLKILTLYRSATKCMRYTRMIFGALPPSMCFKVIMDIRTTPCLYNLMAYEQTDKINSATILLVIL